MSKKHFMWIFAFALLINIVNAITLTTAEYNQIKNNTLIHGAFTENCTSNIINENNIQGTTTGTVTFDSNARGCYFASGYLTYSGAGWTVNSQNQTYILYTNTTTPNALRMFFGKANLFGDAGDMYIFANGANEIRLRFDNGNDAIGSTTSFYTNISNKTITAIVNTTGTTETGSIYYNNNRMAQTHVASAMDAYTQDFLVGKRVGDATGQNYEGHVFVVMFINISITENQLGYIIQQFQAGDTNLSVEPAAPSQAAQDGAVTSILNHGNVIGNKKVVIAIS